MLIELGMRVSILCEKKFPESTTDSHLTKLIEEAKEAKENPDNVYEYADCLLALIAAAKSKGITMPDLMKAAAKKIDICYERDWEKMQDGTYHHVIKSADKWDELEEWEQDPPL
jgi:phosphoribosyl-ATP pyrophosphohydrolase